MKNTLQTPHPGDFCRTLPSKVNKSTEEGRSLKTIMCLSSSVLKFYPAKSKDRKVIFFLPSAVSEKEGRRMR